jgi:hypothetical protein
MDFAARGAGVISFQIIWGEFVLASEGDHEGRPRQNRQWFPIHHQT